MAMAVEVLLQIEVLHASHIHIAGHLDLIMFGVEHPRSPRPAMMLA